MDGYADDTNNKRIAKQLYGTMTHINLDAEVLESGEIFRHVAVTVHETKVVLPAEPTEEGHFYLSNIDQMLIEPVETFFVYLPNRDRSSEEVFSVLEIALGKLLVPYHFMAGRFEVEPGALTSRQQTLF